MTDETGKTQSPERLTALHHKTPSRHESDLAAFEAYWHGMRRGADVPLRTEIDPRGIETLLSNAFIVEKIAPGLARLRIAGAHLSELLGMEVRGMPLSALIEPGDRDSLADALVELFERPAKIRLDLTAPGGPFRQATTTGTMLILPLRSDLGDISRALGCLVTTGPILPAPRRFRISGCKIAPIPLQTESRQTSRGFAESPATFCPDRRHPSERPWLRLVKTD